MRFICAHIGTRLTIFFAAAIGMLSAVPPACAATTLDIVRSRGVLNCGVSTGVPGFSARDETGRWSGFDVDFCKAVAVAIFGDASKVAFVPTTTTDRFAMLQSGQIDLLSRNTTWTLSRDSSLGFTFGAVTFFDGQGFMVRRSVGAKTLADLKGSTICVQSGTTTELNLADYFRTHNIEHTIVTLLTVEDAVSSYSSGRCDVFTTDSSGLYAQRSKLPKPEDHVILPDIISKEPLGPAVRQGDTPWFTLVKWTHYAMLNAEELGVTSNNVHEMTTSPNPDIRRLLGQEAEFGKGLGLTNDWIVRIITAVGNYGESFERNIGAGSPLKIARANNALWSQGGLQYAPPIR